MAINNNYQGFSQIPNKFIEAIPELNLTANQIKLCLKLFKISFGKSIFKLNDSIRNSLMTFLNVKKWDRVKRVLNLLQEKKLIFFKEVKCQIEVTLGKLLQNMTTIRPDGFNKTSNFTMEVSTPNTLINTSSLIKNKESVKEFLPSYIPDSKTENLEGKNFSVNSISNNLTQAENLKGINLHSNQQPILKCQSNNVKIDCKYISALTQQMKKYNYSTHDIELTEKLIFRAKNKGTSSGRINDLAKALIYNRIDKSPKRKPINDLKAFIISSLFSKEEKHIFHKLENLHNFPFEPIKTNEDITIEIQREKEIKLKQLFEEDQKRRSQEQQEYETMKSVLMEKLADNYETKIKETKNTLAKIKNWFITPEIFAIRELYKNIFLDENDTFIKK